MLCGLTYVYTAKTPCIKYAFTGKLSVLSIKNQAFAQRHGSVLNKEKTARAARTPYRGTA